MVLNKFKKLNIFLFMPALFAGLIFFLCAFSFTVPKGVTVDGVDVGGMAYVEAATLLRRKTIDELNKKALVIRGRNQDYTFTYPEINFKDDLYKLIKNARRGEKIKSSSSYYLCGIDSIIAGIADSECVPMVEPFAEFKASSSPFVYHSGNDGLSVDKVKLKSDILLSLKGGFEPVTAAYIGVNRTKTLEEVKEATTLLSRFTTYYDGDNLARSSNIRLAAAKINGKILNSKKMLSFNDIVGARLKSRGFLPAKIIENGEYTEGVGGGVCQVSTTLYNAALLSGLEITEYHPHSLSVGYVPPSRDAMVSGTYYDLKIVNSLDYPVYICARTGKNFVSFEIYGMYSERTFSITSEVTGNIPAPEEECNEPEKVRDGKDGIISQSYLTVCTDGYSKTTLLRKDKYLPVKKLVYSGDGENDDT